MNSLYLDIRWPVGLGLAYVFLVLFFFAGHEVGRMEANAEHAERIVRGE